MNLHAHRPDAGAARDRGDLRTTPFAELLVALLEARRSGTLHVHDEQGNALALIRFDAGRPVAARARDPEPGLLEVLVPLCARSEGAFAFEEGIDAVGDAPGVVDGKLDPLALIAAAMRGPVREDAVNRVLGELGHSLLERNPRVAIERYAFTQQEQLALAMLWQGPFEALQLQGQTEVAPHLLRRLVYVLAITRGLTIIPAVHRNASGTIAHVSAPPPPITSRPPRGEKPTAVMPLDAPFGRAQTAPVSPRAQATLLEGDSKPRAGDRARRSRMAASGTVSATPAGRYHVRNPSEGLTELPAAALEIGLPRDLPPALQLWGQEILERARLMSRQNYYEALGLLRDCRVEDVDAAYQKVAKHFDPEQLPPELDAVRDHALAIVDYALNASTTLRSPARRREYDRELDAGGAPGLRPQVQRGMQAEAHYRRAEALLKRKDYAGAQQEVERALSLGGSCARYEALFGWLLFLRTSATGRVHPRARDHLMVALKRDPRCEQAHYYLAEVLKQSGQLDKAYEHWKRALKLNPNNLDAAREIRLYEMRKKPASPGTGLLDRLLGRKSIVPPKGKSRPAR